MKAQHRFRHFFALMMSIGSLCIAPRSGAEERALAAAAADKLDAVLVLDASGSMLATDPLRLREEGARLFMQFLKPGDRLAIVSFAETATVVQEIKEYNAEDQAAINGSIASIQSTGQYTNLLAGIELGKRILENNARKGANPVIILMSDGKMDPPPSAAPAAQLTQQLTNDLLPMLKQQGVKVYTLAFSDQADKNLLQEVAAIADGINWFTPTADKIHESFADLFLAVKKPQVVPLTKRGFKIDPDVQEATFYMNREDAEGAIELISPDGKAHSATTADPSVKWFSGQKFEVVTIVAPTAGDWQITGVATSEGFATVLTKIRLVTEWPTNLIAQNKVLLEARLYEEDKPIALPEMSGVVKYAFQIMPTDKVSEPILRDFLNDEGKNGDRIEGDGIFSTEVELEEAGEYRLRVLARAPTFERNQQIPFRVKPPLVSLTFEHPEQYRQAIEISLGEEHESDAPLETEESENKREHALVVRLSEDAMGMKKASVRLFATDENKQRYEIPLVHLRQQRGVFAALSSALPFDGKFKLQATFSGEGRRQQEFRGQTKLIEYVRKLGEDVAPDAIQIVSPTKKKDPKDSPVIPIILMTLLNAGAGAFVLKTQRKSNAESNDDVPTFESIEAMERAFSALRTQLEAADLNLEMPLFTDPDYQLREPLGGIPADDPSPESPEVKESSSNEPPQEAEDAPQEEGELGEEGASAEGEGAQ